MNFELARFNMIQQQIRTWEVLDTRVLDLCAQVHREDFVPSAYRQLAFADTEIPLAHDEVMMTPKVEARLLQALQIQSGESVLEIGTGSGYLTALLGHLAAQVTSVDIHAEFTAAASHALMGAGVNNVRLETGNGAFGWGTAEYDVIVITGSLPAIGGEWTRQLRAGGRLFAILGDAPIMEATLLTQVAKGQYTTEGLFETVIPPLRGVPIQTKFVL